MASGRIEAGAVILAAGLSTRFGGHPKALAKFDGRPLLEAAVNSFRLCGLDKVIVVTGHVHQEVGALATALGAEVVFNPDYQQGMFSSVQTGVRAVGAEEAFFCSASGWGSSSAAHDLVYFDRLAGSRTGPGKNLGAGAGSSRAQRASAPNWRLSSPGHFGLDWPGRTAGLAGFTHARGNRPQILG